MTVFPITDIFDLATSLVNLNGDEEANLKYLLLKEYGMRFKLEKINK